MGFFLFIAASFLFMGFLSELMKLTRIEHAIMLALAVIIGESVVLGKIPDPHLLILLSVLVPIFSEMGSFALNDYLDIEADRKNEMNDRPLVKGTISPGFAVWFSAIALFLSTILALFININAFAIALVFNALAVAYNWKLKDLPLLGNIYIGFSMSIPFIFGNFVVANSLHPVAGILALLGFVAGLAREIVKSVEDVEGDMKARGSRTLPIVIGRKPALAIASLLYLIFVPLTLLPFFDGLSAGIPALVLVSAADIGILYIAVRLIISDDEKTIIDSRKKSLLFLFIGLIGLLIASI
jgi:geranylgeranylglycerol-phosphate geranylgeranyltransferase